MHHMQRVPLLDAKHPMHTRSALTEQLNMNCQNKAAWQANL